MAKSLRSSRDGQDTPSDAAPLELEHVAARTWDAIVVGAGPAGALAALLLARRGARVLLVERKAFPRDKVCGGCVSHQAVALLKAAGLETELTHALATPTRAVRLYAAGRQAEFPIPPGLALPRRDLDALLVEAAIGAGALFLPRTTAEVGAVEESWRLVRLQGPEGRPSVCRASVVLAADGLALAGLPAELSRENRVAPRSRIGVGVVLRAEEIALNGDPGGVSPDDCSRGVRPSIEVEPGMIHMTVGRQGYVGLAPISGGRLMVAAAVERGLVAAARSPAAAVATILTEAGRGHWAEALGHTRGAAWSGTPPLTHRLHKPYATRLYVLGDAASYVEPFTGEGIGWALAAAQGVVAPALAARRAWSEAAAEAWAESQRRSLDRRRLLCRAVATGLRSPRLVTAAMRLLALAPRASAPVVWLWNRPLPTAGEVGC